MKYWIVLSVALYLYIPLAVQASSPTMTLADPVPDPCKPENDDDIASSDPLVNHMFDAYKKQAQSESPAAEHATTLEDVNAHEMLGRLFFFLDKHLREAPGRPKHEGLDSTAKYLFHLVHANDNRWAAERKWPYRCFNVETMQALEHFLVNSMKSISQTAVQDEVELAMLVYSIFMRLPQFATYAKNLEKTSLHLLCPLVHSNENIDETLRWIKIIMESGSSIAETACQPPYESELFCNLPAVKEDLDSMLQDYKRAGSSAEMKLFAFFWFLAPGLSHICDDSFKLEFSTNVLNPHGQSVVARLDEIIQLSSTTGTDLEKIRSLIYDYVFNFFTKYAASGVEMPWLTKTPFSSADSPESKYNTITRRTNIHPKPEKDFMTCFRTFIATLNDMETALVKDADMSEIHALARTALFWFLHPDFQLDSTQHYNSFLDGLSYNMEHTGSLVKLGRVMNNYHNTICISSNPNNPVKFCYLYDILHDVQFYAITLEEMPTMKILNPSSNYKKIIELSTMRTIQTDIAALEIGQEQLEQSLFNMRSSIGNHFHQLATFDQDKAEYDAGFLQGKLADFSTRIRNTKIKDKLYTLLHFAIGSNVAELAQLVTQLAAAIAENCNPIAWLTGGGGVQEVLDQANALAVAGVDTAKLIQIHEEVFPRITKKGNAISKAMSANSEVHDKLNLTFHQLKDKESIEIDTVQHNFMMDYKNYDPGMSNGDITEYIALLKGAIDELCEILYGGDTVASAVVQMVGASKSVCLNIKTNAEVLEAIYQEMYSFQYDFMEAMAVAIRALVTKHSANSVRNLPEEADDPELYRLILKFFTYRIKLQSKQHVLLALREVCDVDEYKNGGVLTNLCERALASQAFSDIDRVIGDPITECPSDQTSEFDVRFPARLNPGKDALEPGVLDLTKLYSGELTPFTIPYAKSFSWTQKYVSYAVPTFEDVALYVKRFELFLPDMTENVRHDITVTVKQDGAMNVAPSGSVKYGFSTPKVFNLVYGENKLTCTKGFDDSLYPELCPPKPSKICIASRGVVSDNEIAPPLFSNWLIQLLLPRDLPMPKPSSQAPFYLRGVLSICHKNPKNIDLSEQPRPSTHGSVSEDRCCPHGQYWYISEFFASTQGCNDCPPRSTPKLGGMYCHDTSQPEDGHRHMKHHGHHHHRKRYFNMAIKKHKKHNKTRGEQK